MAHTELNLRERRAIEDMLNAKMPVSKIATELGRHRSSLYREIKRNRFVDAELSDLNGYWGLIAQRKADGCRSQRRKLLREAKLRERVEHCLSCGWTPGQIAGRMHYEGAPERVCQEMPWPQAQHARPSPVWGGVWAQTTSLAVRQRDRPRSQAARPPSPRSRALETPPPAAPLPFPGLLPSLDVGMRHRPDRVA
ncbi:transposase [Halodurantibacterium flavum]|uniref:Transposase n=1 Tax=Halodurantibacterium flavum TaxID=1382802 RepID=A0ABW4S088_9RHOB